MIWEFTQYMKRREFKITSKLNMREDISRDSGNKEIIQILFDKISLGVYEPYIQYMIML